MPYVVEMSGYDTVAGAEKTVRFAMGEGIAFTDVPYAPGALMRWTSASQRVELGAEGMVELRGDTGEVMISNFPDSVLEEAPFDALADWIWKGREGTLYSVEGTTWAGAVVVAGGLLEQPVANVDTGGGQGSVLRFVLRDPRGALETPLQAVRFAGDNVGPVGLEGGADLKGQPKPIIYGLVSNISPPLVNQSLLIYQIADKPVTVLCVRDGGIPLGQGDTAGSLALLQSTEPAPGTYDQYIGAEGSFIRLGSSPVFNLTADADEAETEADQSHAQIWSRIRTERLGSTQDADSILAADAVDSWGAGFYWASEITQQDALAEVLSSFSGYEVRGLDGSWRIAKLTLPEADPEIELVQLHADVRLKASSRAMTTITKVRPRYAQDGSPPFRVNVTWGHNYTVMAPADFAGAAALRLKEKFATETRAVSASNSAIWNPETQTGRWWNAPELTIRTAYQPGADGVTSDGAQIEALRLLSLLTVLRGQYTVEFMFEVGDDISPGTVVKMIHPRMGLDGGPVFRILASGLTISNGVAKAELVIGLQADAVDEWAILDRFGASIRDRAGSVIYMRNA